MKPVETGCSEDGKVRFFRFEFKPPIKHGGTLTYSWGVSFPRMFLIGEEDCSDFLCVNQFHELNLVVRFTHPDVTSRWSFEEEPKLLVLDPLNQQIDWYPPLVSDGLCWTEYSWLHIRAAQGNRYRALWKPEKAEWNTKKD